MSGTTLTRTAIRALCARAACLAHWAVASPARWVSEVNCSPTVWRDLGNVLLCAPEDGIEWARRKRLPMWRVRLQWAWERHAGDAWLWGERLRDGWWVRR